MSENLRQLQEFVKANQEFFSWRCHEVESWQRMLRNLLDRPAES